ncbi:MAG: ribonuclease R [Lachnospiraceae bacterium]|nr:ribonuclease R [Lachnospiraceae bacterium]
MDKQWETRKNNIVAFMQHELYVPMKEKELAIMLQVEKEDREAFKQALEELCASHKIQVSKRGKYMLFDEKSTWGKSALLGTFISNASGFGCEEVDGQEEDIFIPREYTNTAFHLDTVEVAILPSKGGKRKEGQIVRVLERSSNAIVGIYQKSRHYGFVVPDNGKIANDIFIASEHSMGAVDGHKVVVELISYGSKSKNPEGKVVEILGHINDPGVDILSIVKGYDIPNEFPEKVLHQAARMPEEISEADREGRSDLRDVVMVTIDGEDAKDLDDAVSVSFENGLYHLGVHIADVTNYVQEGSALDREALKRGTSVYLVDRVIPMLPHRLSNGICSLNAGVDRLALSCLMTINDKGDVVDYKIEETVICVNKRMSYTSVKKILEDKDLEEMEKYQDLVPMFLQMQELSGILRKKRQKRGSIDFDFPESKIVLDEKGHPTEIKPYDRNVATKIIEDFMLMANETIAQHFYWLEMPFVYRCHENPDPEKIQKLASFIYNFGYSLKVNKEEVHPKEIQKLLGKVSDTPEEGLISRLALRSMKQAKYTVENTGHFGLACEYYCHFTSPIRRYPDLQIHRIIKDWIRGRMKRAKMEHYESFLESVASQSSKMERRAEEAERETNKLKKVEYMEDHIGETFEGVISGVTAWGLYVELPNTVEGLIHISKIPGDYYLYDERSYEMVGRDTGRRYKLGQTVKIVVVDTDKELRTIDFMIEENGEEV